MTRVLVIEDDPMVGEWLEDLFTRSGFSVSLATNGQDGLDQHKADPADAVITDMIMPEKEGVETIADFRRDYPDVPVIAISGGGRTGPTEYLKTAELLGAARVFDKPLDGEALLAAVRELTPAS